MGSNWDELAITRVLKRGHDEARLLTSLFIVDITHHRQTYLTVLSRFRRGCFFASLSLSFLFFSPPLPRMNMCTTGRASAVSVRRKSKTLACALCLTKATES